MKIVLNNKVSIITVCKNSEMFIESCLNSVQSQSYKNIEHIIIDGDSNDSTIKKIMNHNNFKNIKLHIEKDNGIYDAINKGLRLSTGDIIGIFNSDDLYEDNNVISDVVNIFKTLNSNFVYGDIYHVKRNNISDVTRYWKSGKFSKLKIKFGWLPPHPACFYSKKLINNSHYNEKLKISSDLIYLKDILESDKAIPTYIQRVLVRQRDGGISTSGLKNIIINNYEFFKYSSGTVQQKIIMIICKLLRKLFQIRIF